MIFQGGSTCPLRWNWQKHRTEPALQKTSRAAKRRHRKNQASKAIEAREGERQAALARKDSGLMDSPEDIPLVGKAVRGGWGIHDGIRTHIAQKMVEHASSPDPHAAVKAARVLVAMNEQQEQFLKDTSGINDDGPKPSEIVPEVMEKHGDVLAALRSAALASDSQPGSVCAPCEPGAVEAGEPSGEA